jgi:hypothetical protein
MIQHIGETGPHLDRASVVDLARGLDGAGREAAQAHLVVCPSCRDTIGVWTQLAVVAREDLRTGPPDSAVQKVLRLAERARPVSVITRLLAILRYDGTASPVPAGVRAVDRPGQIVYEAEGVAVDVRISREMSHRTVIIGQITDCLEPSHQLADLPVLLHDGNEVAVRGLSNAWGEFHLEHLAQDELRLEVALAGGRVIEVPLPGSRQRGDQ